MLAAPAGRAGGRLVCEDAMLSCAQHQSMSLSESCGAGPERSIALRCITACALYAPRDECVDRSAFTQVLAWQHTAHAHVLYYTVISQLSNYRIIGYSLHLRTLQLQPVPMSTTALLLRLYSSYNITYARLLPFCFQWGCIYCTELLVNYDMVQYDTVRFTISP